MPKDFKVEPRKDKIETVDDLRKDIEESSSLLLTDYRGLTVTEQAVLRRSLGETGTEYRVVKNSLFKLAAKDLEGTGLYDLLAGPTAVAFIHNDPIAPAKKIVDSMRDHKELQIKGGLVDGNLYTAEQVQALSKVPPHEVLVAQMLGSLQSPIVNFVGSLQGLLSNLVYTLDAIVREKEAA